jgi:hypothetical protein
MHAAIFSDQMQPARPLERFDLQLFDRLVDIIRFTPASESERTAVEAAARAIGQQTEVFSASTETDIERAFPAIAQRYLVRFLSLSLAIHSSSQRASILSRWRRAMRFPRSIGHPNMSTKAG